MTPTYAAGTDVPSDRSRREIERTVTRYGATSFAYGWEGNQAAIGFTLNNRQIRLMLPLPDPASAELSRTPTGKARTATAAHNQFEQAVKQRWRALTLVVKAKLEAVEAGIVTFEQEFAMHVVLPDGRTVAQHVSPAIEQAYATGQVPRMLQIEARS